MADILFELGCEELPPKALYGLAEALFTGVTKQLQAEGFEYAADSRWFASPRRLAFQLNDITEQLADKQTEKRGPAVAAAFDEAGHAKPAAMGFARSVGVEVSELTRIATDKGEYLAYTVLEKGPSIKTVLPAMIAQSIKQLPIPKPMRWGSNDYSFIRPVHWMVLLKDSEVIPLELFGLTTTNQSLGHRFHHNEFITIAHARDYVSALQDAHIMVDQVAREALIKQQVQTAAERVNGVAQISQSLLSEVSSIVEKPVAMLGEFNEDFLAVPKEALISSMEKHQKYFSVESKNGELMPYFVALANIDSKNPAAVKKGFEKVITPRLADARFFWEKDQARPLADNIPLLEKMVFEKTLGTLADKCQRVKKLLHWMQPQLGYQLADADRAADLLKTDLMSDMVDEFPDLQGLMGGYYATAQGESDEVAQAIRDQYLPKFVGDDLPATALGQAVAIADKVDTLCGIFAVGKKPSGSKDPFALRRATLSIINILKDKKITIGYQDLLQQAFAGLGFVVDSEIKIDVDNFFLDRLKNQYQSTGISHDVVAAVSAMNPVDLVDFDARVKATVAFKAQPFAKSLIEANKRSTNIINKSNKDLPVDIYTNQVNPALFEVSAENELFQSLNAVNNGIKDLIDGHQYEQAYESISALASPLDHYFEEVMVNADDEQIKINRLTQLTQVAALTGCVADLSELVKS
ncbi:glycine--tRNA ligase subunit beta [Marinicella sp. S1101]|uniref:glycine--tRNA ligase subunit beta n=1 Tax=Marinicella marina TaxID=2996016 RepID=UPI002260C8FD|nr:glycine--tRNA ligase subunit beta [Marinicella marina]MCX7553016.1 glycine--tRNA ligase subunit beta [Marinicella marina]MDJ1139674.1 glycine--tRNA ligase subunit beta [Marinicella marina]